MKRRDLEKYLRSNRCEPARDRGPHEVWRNTQTEAIAPVPRHKEIKTYIVASICKKLGIPAPDQK
ncbi:MAG: type II toxin-antitoxin system HicA family toxin [Planctomycetota bacterium]